MHLSVLLDSYSGTPIGHAFWVRPRGNHLLENFQLVVAATEALERIGRISILEIREENRTGRRLIDAVHVHRLK